MKIPEDQARLKGLLQETITLLCKNGLNYKAEFSVEALIVVTLDKEQMFHTNIKETIAKEGVSFSVETLDSDSEKDGSIVTKSRKYGKKRRKQRDDSMEVPSKRSSSQVYGEESPSITLTEDERQCNSEKQVKDEHDEDSSDSVIIKDEQKKLSENPVPLADLELVDGSEQGSLQYGAGVWNVQDTEQNASMLGGTGDAANQEQIDFLRGNPYPSYGNIDYFDKKSPVKSNVVRFACHICLQTFGTRSTLNRHLKSIHGNTQYECPYCEKKFRRNDNLSSHIIKIHNNLQKECQSMESTITH